MTKETQVVVYVDNLPRTYTAGGVENPITIPAYQLSIILKEEDRGTANNAYDGLNMHRPGT